MQRSTEHPVLNARLHDPENTRPVVQEVIESDNRELPGERSVDLRLTKRLSGRFCGHTGRFCGIQVRRVVQDCEHAPEGLYPA